MKPVRTPRLFIEGLAFWSPTLPGWDVASAAFRGEGGLTDPPAKRPAPPLLPPAERRRAPDTVALALEVAAAAVAATGRDATTLPCVFASAHGDLAINDYMCTTLAAQPTLLSPTKFHNSVHNAPVGYWTIATGCMQASNSVAAFNRSFAAGFLEAATQCAADNQTVLLVGYDVTAVGALASAIHSEGMLAVALVLSPQPTAHTVAWVDWELVPAGLSTTDAAKGQTEQRTALKSSAALSLAQNAMADALPVFEALASDLPGDVNLPVSAGLALQLHLEPQSPDSFALELALLASP